MQIVDHIKHSIINNRNNNNKNTIYIKHLLIDIYGLTNNISNAFDIFNSISSNNKNIYSICAIMKFFINNNKNTKVIELHLKYNSNG